MDESSSIVLGNSFSDKIKRIQNFSTCYWWDPQGLGGSGENGYLFLGSLGALVIIFRDLGSKLIVLGI